VHECVQDQFIANEMAAGLEEEEEPNHLSVVGIQFAVVVCALDLDVTVVQTAVTFSLALSGGHLPGPGGCTCTRVALWALMPLLDLLTCDSGGLGNDHTQESRAESHTVGPRRSRRLVSRCSTSANDERPTAPLRQDSAETGDWTGMASVEDGERKRRDQLLLRWFVCCHSDH